MESNKGYKRKFIKILKDLRQTWRYSDSQPTEIVLALSSIILAPIALGLEIGGLYIFRAIIVISGVYQLFCVSQHNLKCRVKAAMLTFGMYLASSIMFLFTIGFPTPTHYGWIIFVVASFGSMQRLILEKIHKEKNG